MSQIINFHTYVPLTPTEIMNKITQTTAVKEGRLRVYDCQRVPKKFHAQFSATWRRYLYLFPLNNKENDINTLEMNNNFDVNITLVNDIFSRYKSIHSISHSVTLS